MSNRSLNLQALVLKRVNVGETDRVVTLLSKEKGKFVAVAKGVRKLKSSKRAYMEPGNIIKAQLIITKSLPLLIQAKLIHDSAPAKQNLATIRKLIQILEVFDKLLVEQEIEPRIYNLILDIRQTVIARGNSHQLIQNKLSQLISLLGFPAPQITQGQSVLDYVQNLAEKPMRSFQFLQVKTD